MILAVDVGNTRVKFGLFRPANSESPQVVRITAHHHTSSQSHAQALAEWVGHQDAALVTACIIAGSNPDIRDQLIAAWPFPNALPFVVNNYRDVPIQVDVEAPETVGIDRLLNGIAVRELCKAGQTCIVVDSGTATTVNLITSDCVFRGGSILPGLRLSAHALHDYTARLPLIDADTQLAVEPPVLGRNTLQAMSSGLFWGQLGAIRELIARLSDVASQTFGEQLPATVIMTGGGGRLLLPYISTARYIDSLALHGLAHLVATPDAATDN